MEALEDKITKASKSTNAGFKRKKIRSMKREADKIAEKLKESGKALKLLEPRVPKDSGALRNGSQRSLKYLICIFENQIIPCFTFFRIMYLFKPL